VGDVYLGRVRKMVPHLNAAFVDVGYEKDESFAAENTVGFLP
jgi:Ribonuclease G/E